MVIRTAEADHRIQVECETQEVRSFEDKKFCCTESVTHHAKSYSSSSRIVVLPPDAGVEVRNDCK